jgi:hypothetical protein
LIINAGARSVPLNGLVDPDTETAAAVERVE